MGARFAATLQVMRSMDCGPDEIVDLQEAISPVSPYISLYLPISPLHLTSSSCRRRRRSCRAGCARRKSGSRRRGPWRRLPPGGALLLQAMAAAEAEAAAVAVAAAEEEEEAEAGAEAEAGTLPRRSLCLIF